MKTKVKKFKEISGIEMILLRQKLGFKRYRKTRSRDKRKKEILLKLALKKIEEKEREDFLLVGFRRRKLTITSH